MERVAAQSKGVPRSLCFKAILRHTAQRLRGDALLPIWPFQMGIPPATLLDPVLVEGPEDGVI